MFSAIHKVVNQRKFRTETQTKQKEIKEEPHQKNDGKRKKLQKPHCSLVRTFNFDETVLEFQFEI